ncbi:MAG: DUF2914 domain-containing protein [Planctomycetota bacterium]|jgi:hypothetical protein
MNKKITLTFLILVIISAFSIANAVKEKPGIIKPENPESRPNLVKAVMCEDLKGRVPQYPAVVFSNSLGKVFCFTDFDPVLEKTFVYHNWYFRELKRASVKLSLNTPRWATFSTVQMRETDKGPWRVEITDLQGNILKTLRFSITD